MDYRFLQILFLFFCLLGKAQIKHFILIDNHTGQKFLRKDSLSAVAFLDSLATNNFYFTKIKDIKKESSQIKIIFDKGKNFNQTVVHFSEEITNDFNINNTLKINNLDSLKQKINQFYAERGFSFNRVKTKYLGTKNNIPEVEISILKGAPRTINGFVLKNQMKIPKQFIKNLEKKYIGKIYNDKIINKIYQYLKNNHFIQLEKPPQTLFTKDSTQIFLFLQKKKSHIFDGIIGFGNDKSDKINFNGTLNIAFQNILNSFESIDVYWQRTPDKFQTFELKTQIPYIAKDLGVDFQLNIYRQDSTFANVKALPGIFYGISDKHKVGIRGNFEISSVLDVSYTSAKDFSRSGVGFWYDWRDASDIDLFVDDTKLRVELDLLKTNYINDKIDNSKKIFLLSEKNFNIIKNHFLNLKIETVILDTKTELSTNELFRIGGWNSLRGFNERSILASSYAYGGIEYRYLANEQSFFDGFVQYGFIHNKRFPTNTRLYSFGLGFNMLLPIGLMSFQISNGSQIGEAFQFKETKIHWGIVAKF